MRDAGRVLTFVVLVLVGIAAVLVIKSVISPKTTTTATATPVVQAQASAVQLIQCADGVIRATCPPLAPTTTPVPATQTQNVASNPQPTNTPMPHPTATNPPAATNTPAPTTPPQIESFDRDLGVCPQCTIPTSIGQHQVVLVHGDINQTGTCHYRVYTPGQQVQNLGSGQYRVKLIQGSQDYIDAEIKSDVAGAGAAIGGSCPAG